jgi:hypothetical protein
MLVAIKVRKAGAAGAGTTNVPVVAAGSVPFVSPFIMIDSMEELEKMERGAICRFKEID